MHDCGKGRAQGPNSDISYMSLNSLDAEAIEPITRWLLLKMEALKMMIRPIDKNTSRKVKALLE